MLFYKKVLIVLFSFLVNYVKSEEVLNVTTTEPTTTIFTEKTTENFLNFLNLEDVSTMDYKTNSEVSTNDSSSTTSITELNVLKDKDTTPSWELIYPEPNTTNSEKLISSTTASTLTTTTPTTPASTSLKPVLSLPKYFKVDDVANCQKYFNQCLKQVLTKVLPKLKDGSNNPQLPSLDPIHFNSTAFQYNSGPFTGYITIRYALIYGLTSIQFKKIEFFKGEGNKFKARFSMIAPKMSVMGAYKGDIHVNNVRARPRGDFNVTMTGLGVEMVTLGVVEHKDDHAFLRLTKNNATTTLKDSKISASGIFEDQRLNDIVVNVANQYWRDLFSIVLPETRSNWLPILTDALNAALAMVPFDFFK